MTKPLTETKHFGLTRQLRQEICKMGAGEAVATVEELKARYGVSQATITRAIERLRKEGLIYRPAGRKRLFVSDMAGKNLRRVLVLRSTFPSPDYDAIVRELLNAGRVFGWSFSIHAVQWDQESVDLNRLAEEYDGLVFACSPDAFKPDFLAALRKPKCPMILIRDLPDDPLVPGVTVDNVKVGELAVEHLARLGHRNILAVVSGVSSRTITDRVRGWRRGMEKLGCSDTFRMLVDCTNDPGQATIMITWERFRQWMRNPARPEFSAIFTVDWTGALAVSRVLYEEWNLSIPEDISVISYAGETTLLSFLRPPLTTVAGDPRMVAERALHMLEVQWNNNELLQHQVLLQPFVVERKSTRGIGESIWPEPPAKDDTL